MRRAGPSRKLIGALAVAALATSVFATQVAATEHDHHHASHCDESNPAVQDLIAEVQYTLEHQLPDELTLASRGFIPYFDTMMRGYPKNDEGAGHWLNPEWIDDGDMLNPRKPESVLVDEWGNPMGAMFIADEEYPHGVPIYVNDDGTPCQPWHGHTDVPARFAWWYYETLYDGDAYNGEVEPDEVTAAMFHVWAIPNDKGWNAHGYPEAKYREGPPDSTEDLPGMQLPQLPGGNP